MALQIAISKMSGAEKGGGGKESEGEKNNGGSSQHLQEKDLENSKSVYVYLLFCSCGAVFNKMVYHNVCRRKFRRQNAFKSTYFLFYLSNVWINGCPQRLQEKDFRPQRGLKKIKIRVKKFRRAPRAIIYYHFPLNLMTHPHGGHILTSKLKNHWKYQCFWVEKILILCVTWNSVYLTGP